MGNVGLYRFIAASILVLMLVGLDLIIGTFLVPAVLSDGEDVTSAEKHPVIVDNVPYGYTFRANVDILREFGPIRYHFRTNSLGFKDSEVRDVPLTGTKRRVLIIGDSFADGIGFSFNDTMVGRLSTQFPDVEFLNAAVQSYFPTVYFKKIKYLVEIVGLQMDEVVVFLDISDIDNEYQRSDWQTTKQFLRDHSLTVQFAYALKNFLFGRFDSHSVTEFVKKSIAANAVLKVHPWKGLWTVDPILMDQYARIGLEVAEEKLSKLSTFLASRKIPMTLVVYPWPHQILLKDRDSIQVRVWRSWAESNVVDFVNLFEPFFEDKDGVEVVRRYFVEGDVHWNLAGHELVADRFSQKWAPQRSTIRQ